MKETFLAADTIIPEAKSSGIYSFDRNFSAPDDYFFWNRFPIAYRGTERNKKKFIYKYTLIIKKKNKKEDNKKMERDEENS